jgi:hypothetical protein
MLIVLVLLLGVLQCSINKYTGESRCKLCWWKEIHISQSCTKVVLQSIFSLYWNYCSKENTQIFPFSGVPRNLGGGGGSTNSVEDRWQREGSGGISP